MKDIFISLELCCIQEHSLIQKNWSAEGVQEKALDEKEEEKVWDKFPFFGCYYFQEYPNWCNFTDLNGIAPEWDPHEYQETEQNEINLCF